MQRDSTCALLFNVLPLFYACNRSTQRSTHSICASSASSTWRHRRSLCDTWTVAPAMVSRLATRSTVTTTCNSGRWTVPRARWVWPTIRLLIMLMPAARTIRDAYFAVLEPEAQSCPPNRNRSTARTSVCWPSSFCNPRRSTTTLSPSYSTRSRSATLPVHILLATSPRYWRQHVDWAADSEAFAHDIGLQP